MAEDGLNSFMTGPDEQGRFGMFGGRFVSETLMPLILELEARYDHAKTDADPALSRPFSRRANDATSDRITGGKPWPKTG
ncbi:hypothetical protein [Mycobacterium tuberculosis]|uniref:hypothetical protein n=1 Tax=Mycobacterium tuberculosis TaxID=1773 RepID=UPI00272D2AFF|nr:hypothetical protein [Mycobacterium tuberculosis]